MTGTRTIPDWAGGASILAVSVGHTLTIPDWTGMPAEADDNSKAERLVARLDRLAFERAVEALRLGAAA